MIENLGESLKRAKSETEKRKAVVKSKQDLMALLMDRSLEYLRVVDP